MIVEVLGWGLKPKVVTGDAWYSSRENLKFLRDKELAKIEGSCHQVQPVARTLDIYGF
jgi:hypothetical protein